MHRSYGPQYSTSTQDAFQLELLRQNLISEQRLRDFERHGNRRRRRQMQHDAEDFNHYMSNEDGRRHSQTPPHERATHFVDTAALPLTLNELMRCEAFATGAVAGAHGGGQSVQQQQQQQQQRQQQQQELVIDPANVVRNLSALGRLLDALQRWPLPRVSLTTACVFFLLAIFVSPRTCAHNIIFPAFRLIFGFLHPAYASYKAVRTKHMREYVKWMMYWIVFALFSCIESFTDIFISWLPFYYEVKVIMVFWLLSPATHGSSILYRKFVHPALERHEEEIDKYLNEAKERGYSAVLQLGSKGVNYATNVIMQTALKGGGNLVQTLKRSYSLSDLSEPDVHRTQDEMDQVVAIRPQQRMLRPRHQTAVGRSASGTRHSTGMYFTEVDISKGGGGGGGGDINYNIRSSEDISSGYSSAEPLSGGGLSRTSSMTNASRTRSKAKRAELFSELSANSSRNASISELNEGIYLAREMARAANDLYLHGQPGSFFIDHHGNLIDQSGVENTEWPLADVEERVEQFTEIEAKIANDRMEYEEDSFFDAISVASDNSVLEADPIVTTNSAKIKPKELRETLEEIQQNFRAHFEDGAVETKRRPVLHNKGKAPAPPTPPPPPPPSTATSNAPSNSGKPFEFVAQNATNTIANAASVGTVGKETEI